MEQIYYFSNLIQKVTIYETKETYFIVGSDEQENYFRVLEINRNERRQLLLYEDQKVYTVDGINAYIAKVKEAERKKGRASNGLSKLGSGYFIAGFVKFTEGYYMILVTSRRKVAMIGSHNIYKVDSTSMVYIPNEKSSRNQMNSEEQRYCKLFENVNFSNNFYFSFTYDLTNTLQYNNSKLNTGSFAETEGSDRRLVVRQEPEWRYVWNEYLLEPVLGKIHDDWIVYLIHCFLSQLNMIVYGRHIYMTVIGRRSNRYAGTRFIKRGVNSQGFVANEVETEQIVFDASQTALNDCYITSYVQMRGSIPLHWSQYITKVMSKPAISLDVTDPYGDISARHFRYVISRYGCPVIILNLVKRNEKRPRESKLWNEWSESIQYLNQFLTNENKIRTIAFDMARSNRKKDSNVLDHLADISDKAFERTGFYVRKCPASRDRLQRGVIRTNCVDCLDRTNTAQFAVGKQALGHQLHALGVIPTTELLFDTDCIRMLEVLYEDQGDTIALQYGGSNLVHRVQSYRKTDPLSSHSNDILQTLQRYYSNSFSDAEKQQAMNIFLGIFRPWEHQNPLWEFHTDHYLHNPERLVKQNYTGWLGPRVAAAIPAPYSELNKKYHTVSRESWIGIPSEFDLAYRTHELTSFDSLHAMTLKSSIRHFMPSNVSLANNRNALSPFEVRRTSRANRRPDNPLTGSGEASISTISSLVLPLTELTSPNRENSSGSIHDEVSNSVFHTGSLNLEDDDSGSEDSNSDLEMDLTSSESELEEEIKPRLVSFADVLQSPADEYDITHEMIPRRLNINIYKQYVRLQNQVNPTSRAPRGKLLPPLEPLNCVSIFPFDSEIEVLPPTVKKESKSIYTRSVLIAQHGPQSITKASQKMYERTVNYHLY